MEDSVLFLRKLSPGGSAHSFGIHVAKMAGMPNSVLLQAENAKALEKNRGSKDLLQKARMTMICN